MYVQPKNSILELDVAKSSNGSSFCYINASLYAFVANPKILQIKNRETEPNLYNELYNIMVKASKTTVWNNSLYESIFKLLNTEKYKLTKPNNLKGQFGDAINIMSALKKAIFYKRNNYIIVKYANAKSSKDNNILNIIQNEILPTNKRNNFTCVSIVCSSPIKDTWDKNCNHFFVYVKINDMYWKNVDILTKTNKIVSTEELDKVYRQMRACHCVYINKNI